MRADRRRHDRSRADLACKMIDAHSGRTLAARTLDVSAGGVLIEVRWGPTPEPGDHLRVFVDAQGRGIAPPDELRLARVVRTPAPNRVALAFAT
ncbi:MAG: PilZ domain-containing protein [Phycisphaeraceae bacterium]|nr:PilZ domain-containing protein [Phycisphaeraceae bacterium]